MSIQGKSVRFGYKAWTLASSDGYVYASDIYSGKSKADHITDSSLGQKGKVVTQMPQVVDKGCPTVYFDNFLLCLIFAVPSNDVRILSCGTMRENQMRSCPLPSKKTDESKERK